MSVAAKHKTIDAHVEKRYQVERELGSGAYGIVWKAIDRKHRAVVALKKVYDAFSNQTDAQRTYREVMFLQQLKHENIIKLVNVMRAENGIDIYLVFELMETDLHATIRGNILQDVHKQFITYQLLRCIRHLHKHDLIHRDLKPANVLLNSDCHVKLADFGLARSLATLNSEQAVRPVLTDYIATRWYRAPEIVLGSTKYTKGVDMWAVGCIIAEMINGKPLLAGSSTLNQMELIVGMLGAPTEDDLASMNSKFAEGMMDKLTRVRSTSIRSLVPNASPEAIDLISQLMTFNPNKRISALEALRHPYVAMFCSAEETADDREVKPITVPICDYQRLTVNEYREALYQDIAKKKKEQRARKKSSVTRLPATIGNRSGSINGRGSNAGLNNSRKSSFAAGSGHYDDDYEP